MPRSPKAVSNGSDKKPKKVPKDAIREDESLFAPPPGAAATQSPGYSVYATGDMDDPEFHVVDDDVQGWDDPPDDWEMEGPPDNDDLVPPLDWGSGEVPDAAIGAAPAALDSDESTNTQLDLFAAHALNGLLAGMLSVPNTSLDTSEVAHMAYNYAEAMLRERQRRLNNQITSLPSIGTGKNGFGF